MHSTPIENQRRLVPLREAASILGIGARALKAAIRSGTVKAVRFSERCTRVSSDELARLLRTAKGR